MSAPRQRLLIRATLVAGMVLAGLGLVAVIKAKNTGGGSAGGPALSRQSLRVKVVDRHGRVVQDANVFVKTTGGAAPAQARWSPQDGVLMLPRRTRPHDLRVLARGYQVKDVDGVGSDRTITLERGLRLRVDVRDVPADGLPAGVRVLLRVRPLDVDAQEADRLTDLMDNLGGSGPRRMPRGGFGYPVSLAQAGRGILVPRPGRYRVHWGLFHLRRGTWFALQDRCGRAVEVGKDGAQLDLVMTLDDLQATLDGLAEGIVAAAERR